MSWDHTDRPVRDVTDLQAAGISMESRAHTYEWHRPYGVIEQLTTMWQPQGVSVEKQERIVRCLHGTRREAAHALLEADALLTDAIVWRDRPRMERADAARRWAAGLLGKAEAWLSEWEVDE